MTVTLTEPAPAPTPVRSRPWALTFRILRTEIRHSAFVWCLPLLVLLFVFDPYRTAASYAPLWPLRATVVLNKFWPDLVVFAAGFSAWAGSREGRRDVGDLLGTTVRAAWTRQLLSFAGTAFWVAATFLAGVAAIYLRTAMVATWGGPPIAPVVVGTVGMIMVCAVGFALGAIFPGRFTAPIVGIGLMIVTLVAFRQSVGSTGGAVAVLSPDGEVPGNDWGVFYRTSTGIPITQCLFMGGVALAALGLLGLWSRTGGVGWRGALSAVAAGGARLRTIALSAFTAGIAALVAGAALASTSTGTPEGGYQIPSIDGTITAQTLPYTPVCSTGAFPVCAHPAYRDFLPHMTSAMAAAVREVAGLPGVPVRAVQVARDSLPASGGSGGTGYGRVTSGGVYEFSMDSELFGGPASTDYQRGFQFDILNAVIFGPVVGPAKTGPGTRHRGEPVGSQPGSGTPAQQAVLDGLLKALGVPAGPGTPGGGGGGGAPGAPVTAAAAKFAA
ncbi:MAG TPA: hypothetical protein VHF26_14340, partial [Trebonia sp.]|nr:hypothetical protein [Trebonia sp.]